MLETQRLYLTASPEDHINPLISGLVLLRHVGFFPRRFRPLPSAGFRGLESGRLFCFDIYLVVPGVPTRRATVAAWA